MNNKYLLFALCSLLLVLCFNLSAQNRYDSAALQLAAVQHEAVQQYVNWIKQAVDEGRMSEARAALLRASDFADISSDISYLLAITRNAYMFEGETRLSVLQALNKAIDTNRWVTYNQDHALLLMAQMLIAMRKYHDAADVLDLIGAVNMQNREDAMMLRLLALRGMASGGNVFALAQFRSQVLIAMDRFPRDPRPLRIFLEYANSRNKFLSSNSTFSMYNELTDSDLYLMELVLRRLPFLLESDPELAWMAVPFISNLNEADRLLASYRSGGIPHVQNRDFMPHPASIPLALNFGQIDDTQATDELFSGSRGINHPFSSVKPFIDIVPALFQSRSLVNFTKTDSLSAQNPILDIEVIIDVYKLLRSEEGRNCFTMKLLSFSGIIISDNDSDGFIDSYTFYEKGVVRNFCLDLHQNNFFDFVIHFDNNGVPVSAIIPVAGHGDYAGLQWERYPSLQKVQLQNEVMMFRPADFQFAPVSFTELGGSRTQTGNLLHGLLYPEISDHHLSILYRTLVLSCFTITRAGVEFEGATETFYMERGLPLVAVQTLNGQQVSVTEFQRGLPVIQYIDMDLDGRMETIRRFRDLSYQEIIFGSSESQNGWQFTDYRRLLASSQSDFSGDGRNITREVYRQDGSVVYSWDLDSSGELNYSETNR